MYKKCSNLPYRFQMYQRETGWHLNWLRRLVNNIGTRRRLLLDWHPDWQGTIAELKLFRLKIEKKKQCLEMIKSELKKKEHKLRLLETSLFTVCRDQFLQGKHVVVVVDSRTVTHEAPS